MDEDSTPKGSASIGSACPKENLDGSRSLFCGDLGMQLSGFAILCLMNLEGAHRHLCFSAHALRGAVSELSKSLSFAGSVWTGARVMRHAPRVAT